MTTLCNRTGHYIFFPVVSSFFLLFFLAYSQLSHIGCLPYFHTWCGPSANLECRSEMCCTRLAGNTGRKKSPKIRHVGAIAQLYFGPLTAEIGSGVWGTPTNFNGFRVLAALLHGTLVVGVSQTLRR